LNDDFSGRRTAMLLQKFPALFHQLKEALAEQMLENRLPKKSMIADGEDIE
jgi:hypothetical protein